MWFFGFDIPTCSFILVESIFIIVIHKDVYMLIKTTIIKCYSQYIAKCHCHSVSIVSSKLQLALLSYRELNQDNSNQERDSLASSDLLLKDAQSV